MNDLALGIPRYNRALISNIQALIPDPEYTSSPSASTTATLRLTYQGGALSVQDVYDLQREQSGSTVLGGFTVLGGAWTFVSGVFATIFGCNLLLVLFGIRPLSIYGLIHLFQQRRSLADAGYALSAEEQSRTVGVLRVHLLDDDGDVEASEVDEEGDRDEERRHLHPSIAA